MDPLENERATAQELIGFARQQGVDLEPLLHETALQRGQRWIFLWRKDGHIDYSLQGAIRLLPERLKESASAFRGVWNESGSFEDIEQAFVLVKSWLIDEREVDDLPSRSLKSYQI